MGVITYERISINGCELIKMKLETQEVLLKAYAQLQLIIDDLYSAHDRAVANNDDDDASLLVSRADLLFEEAENLNIIISEMEISNENS